jgi:hypothetical protein
VRYRLPPPLPTSRATPEKLSQPSVASDDLPPPVARRKSLQGMGWRQGVDCVGCFGKYSR